MDAFIDKFYYIVMGVIVVTVLFFLLGRHRQEQELIINRSFPQEDSPGKGDRAKTATPAPERNPAPPAPNPIQPAIPVGDKPLRQATPISPVSAPSSEFPPGAVVAEKMLPEAKILIDGQTEDWITVPIFFLQRTGAAVKTAHGFRGAKLACDGEAVYAIFLLATGIREAGEEDSKEGGKTEERPLGLLTLEGEGAKVAVRFSTEFRDIQSREGGLFHREPVVKYEVKRYNILTGALDAAATGDSSIQPDSVAFEEKCLEFKLPLSLFPISGKLPVKVRFEEGLPEQKNSRAFHMEAQ
ncbi:MAG: hypothetical protein V1918_09345 [Planctomycetota bacterium]